MPAYAHHSSTIFDLERPVTLEGVVTEYEWANPHVYLYVDTGDGEPAVWEIEASPPYAMTLRGWSPETFAPGDRVVVDGFAAKNAARRMALGVSVVTADGTRLVMSRNAPSIGDAEADPLLRAPADTVPAAGLSATWIGLPPNRDLLPQFLFEAKAWPLTEAGAAAFDVYDESESPAADCIAYTAPFSMVMPNIKIIEIGETRTTIVAAGIGHPERVVHMNLDNHDGAPYSDQGHSIGRWEDAVLVVDTARFAARLNGNALALPSSEAKHLVERFALSENRKRLEYSFVLEDPEYLAEPLRAEFSWTHSPDGELVGGDCNLDNARRYLEGWVD
jgi:hypothetical protein